MPKANRYAKDSAAQGQESPQFKNKRFIYRVSDQTGSPLFRLPLELRTAIWKIVLPHSVRPHLPSTSTDQATFISGSHPQYIFDHTFPLCRWQRGDLSLIRTCKRLSQEVTRTFFASNIFDCLIENQEPCLVLAYGDPALHADLELQRQDARNPGIRLSDVTEPERHYKKLNSIKREHIALIRGWVLAFPTHLGLDFEEQMDEAYYLRRKHPELSSLSTSWWGPREVQIAETLTDARDNGTRWERKDHRRRVLFGVDRWLQLIGAHDAERRLGHLELTFYRYFNCAGKFGKADDMLVEAVKKSLPRWLLVQVHAIN